MRTCMRRGQESVVYNLRSVASAPKKGAVSTRMPLFVQALESARAMSQAEHVRLCGVAAFGYDVVISSLRCGDGRSCAPPSLEELLRVQDLRPKAYLKGVRGWLGLEL